VPLQEAGMFGRAFPLGAASADEVVEPAHMRVPSSVTLPPCRLPPPPPSLRPPPRSRCGRGGRSVRGRMRGGARHMQCGIDVHTGSCRGSVRTRALRGRGGSRSLAGHDVTHGLDFIIAQATTRPRAVSGTYPRSSRHPSHAHLRVFHGEDDAHRNRGRPGWRGRCAK
jgi:hypothetical protein